MNCYIKNNETGKLELHFEKSVYMALSEEQKREIKSAFLWSNHAGAWVSRAIAPNLWRPENIAKSLGLEFRGAEGEKLSFADRVEQKQIRAEERAELFEERSEKALKESENLYNASNKMASVIPLGQPILVGHHSEKSHRRHLEQIDNLMRKASESHDKGNYYIRKHNAAAKTANGDRFNDPVYLDNRIRECEAHIRVLERRLQGKYYTYSTPEPISDTDRQFYNGRLSEEIEKLTFFREKLTALNVTIERHTMSLDYLKQQKARYIKTKYGWFPIKSINAKTVTVLNWMGTGGSLDTWQFRYAEIQDFKTYGIKTTCRPNGATEDVEILPTVKH